MTAPNQPAHVAEYRQHLTAAADALLSAFQTGLTDGGEAISHLLATVAANLGSMDEVTKGRPGSWESGHVSQFLTSTVGPDGEYLLQFRTRPIEIVECVDLAMIDLDVDHLYDESFALIDAAEAEAIESGDEAAAERLNQAWQLIEDLKSADYAAYRVEFEGIVREATQSLIETRNLAPGVPVSVRWVEWPDRELTTGSLVAWGTVEYELWEKARGKTSAPGTCDGSNASAECVPGNERMPHQRIPQLAGYTAASRRPGAE